MEYKRLQLSRQMNWYKRESFAFVRKSPAQAGEPFWLLEKKVAFMTSKEKKLKKTFVAPEAGTANV